jgi:hypothetical protein
MTEQHNTPPELPQVALPGDTPAGNAADARRRRLLGAAAKGLFSGPILVTLANRPAFGWTSACNFSAGASVNPSQAKVKGGDDYGVWYEHQSRWPSGVLPTATFLDTFGFSSSYWNKSGSSDTIYVTVKGIAGASLTLATAVSTSGADTDVVFKTKIGTAWKSFPIGFYCRQATAAYLNEKHYGGNFPLVGVKSMVANDFLTFATLSSVSSTSEQTSNYNQFLLYNNDCR